MAWFAGTKRKANYVWRSRLFLGGTPPFEVRFSKVKPTGEKARMFLGGTSKNKTQPNFGNLVGHLRRRAVGAPLLAPPSPGRCPTPPPSSDGKLTAAERRMGGLWFASKTTRQRVPFQLCEAKGYPSQAGFQGNKRKTDVFGTHGPCLQWEAVRFCFFPPGTSP